MLTQNARNFDEWIRGRFRDLNTELETLYFDNEDRLRTEGVGNSLKVALCSEGRGLISQLVAEGNTDEGFEQNFALLGNVGFFLAACTRHGIEELPEATAALRQASALAMELGACVGVAPRFSSSHLMTHNAAQNGQYKTFTALEDERLFIEQNTLGVLAYKRAADALLRIQPLGISHPITASLLNGAAASLREVSSSNRTLFDRLNPDRFFYSVRPYYKPHKVGFSVYRGANAGDFAGINVIDLLLGLCQSNEASYSQLLVDKFLYMMPEDQLILRDCMRRQSLLGKFLSVPESERTSAWFKTNATSFLDVCDAHGRAAAQHHDELMKRFIIDPTSQLPEERRADLTASGPPLPVVLAALQNLRDQRTAAPRTDIPTRHAEIQQLRAAIEH